MRLGRERGRGRAHSRAMRRVEGTVHKKALMVLGPVAVVYRYDVTYR